MKIIINIINVKRCKENCYPNIAMLKIKKCLGL